MRRGVGAGFPRQQGRSSAYAPSALESQQSSAQGRANVGRLFLDLRHALRLTPHQAAARLLTRVETIDALETAQFELLPPLAETRRVVMAYTAMAGIDGGPVLDAITTVVRNTPTHTALRSGVSNTQPRQPSGRLKQAGAAIANGAKRLPADAFNHVRRRPDRAFYALSLPLGFVLLMLNSSVLEAAFHHVPRPVSRIAQDVRQFFQEQFAPVRDGLRWIDVDDPRRRRGDKLRMGSQSD